MTERPHQFTDPTKRGSGPNVSQDALFSLVGDDPIIRRKIKLLVNMMLEMGFQIMASGTPTDRIAYSKAVLPAIIRASTQSAEGGVGELRAEMQAMFVEMFGESGGEVTDGNSESGASSS